MSVDLPTLGLPTMLTKPALCIEVVAVVGLGGMKKAAAFDARREAKAAGEEEMWVGGAISHHGIAPNLSLV